MININYERLKNGEHITCWNLSLIVLLTMGTDAALSAVNCCRVFFTHSLFLQFLHCLLSIAAIFFSWAVFLK